MLSAVVKKSYPAPPICEREILRYAGCREDTPEISALLRGVLKEASERLTYQVCCREFPAALENDVCDMGFAAVRSPSLARHLKGCNGVVVFAATVGLELDRLIARYGRTAPSKALMLQAVGAERIEALCDAFCEELREQKRAEGLCLKPRFSPGYGDLPLALQKEIFAVLDCPRQIGLTLNSSMLMSPSKSVTAIVGLSPEEAGAARPQSKCGGCENRTCAFRRE